MTSLKAINAPFAPAASPPAERKDADQKLFTVAQKLEASFLAEMLTDAGIGETREAFGGGAGEEHFASFLSQAQAEALVESGGLGLAQSIFEALKERENDQR